MKTNFITQDSIVSDFIEENDIKQTDVDEGLLYKWVEDATQWINTDEQLLHKIALLRVNNYKVEKPSDLKIICEVAFRGKEEVDDCKIQGYEIVQWIKEEDDCDIEINLKCKKCHKKNCTCDTGRWL